MNVYKELGIEHYYASLLRPVDKRRAMKLHFLLKAYFNHINPTHIVKLHDITFKIILVSNKKVRISRAYYCWHFKSDQYTLLAPVIKSDSKIIFLLQEDKWENKKEISYLLVTTFFPVTNPKDNLSCKCFLYFILFLG